MAITSTMSTLSNKLVHLCYLQQYKKKFTNQRSINIHRNLHVKSSLIDDNSIDLNNNKKRKVSSLSDDKIINQQNEKSIIVIPKKKKALIEEEIKDTDPIIPLTTDTVQEEEESVSRLHQTPV